MRVEWTAIALRELGDVAARLSADNPVAAAVVIDTLLELVELVRVFPKLGRPSVHRGAREVVVSRYPYRIIYRTIPGSILVLRVMHTSRYRE